MGIRAAEGAGTIACCLLVSGCTVFDPYVHVDDVHVLEVTSDPSNAAGSSWTNSQKLLVTELKSAQAQANAYRNAAREQAWFRSGLATAGVPLITFAAIETVTTHHGYGPAIAGGVAAGAVGLGGLLSSPTRDAIYTQAEAATSCLFSAYSAYKITQPDYDTYLDATVRALRDDLLAITQAQNALNAAVAAYDADATLRAANQQAADALAAATKAQVLAKAKAAAAHPAPPPAPRQPPAPAPAQGANTLPASTAGAAITSLKGMVDAQASVVLTRAAADVTAGATAQGSLVTLRREFDSAGQNLGDRRMAIKVQVDQAIQATVPTADQINGIKIAAGGSTTAKQAPATAAKPSGSTGGIAQGATDLQPLENELDTYAHKVKDAIVVLNAALLKLEVDVAQSDPWLQETLQALDSATQQSSCTSVAKAVLSATISGPPQVAPNEPLVVQVRAPQGSDAPTVTPPEKDLTAIITTTGGTNYTLTISEVAGGSPAAGSQTVTVTSGSQKVPVNFTVAGAAGTPLPAAPGDPSVNAVKPKQKAPPVTPPS